MIVGWGIVGIGRHADAYMAGAIRKAKNSRLVAVCSRDMSRAQAFSSKHGAQFAYDSYDKMLANKSVDAIYVASPNSQHREHTELAAEAGKHVLCEKPMATSVDDCASMIQTCRRDGVKLGMGFHLRHHPLHLAAREIIRGGNAGRIAFVQGQWAMGAWGKTQPGPRPELSKWWEDPSMSLAGSLVGMGVHIVDLFRFLLNDEFRSVTAFSHPEGEALDHLTAVVARFERGIVGSLVSGRVLPASRNEFTIYGSQARIGGLNTLGPKIDSKLQVVREGKEEVTTADQGDMYTDEISDFNQSIKADGAPRSTGVDGLRANEVLEAVIQARASGRLAEVNRRPP